LDISSVTMVKEIKSLEELEKAFSEAGTNAVLIDFHATWCGPCKQIAPDLQKFSVAYPKVVVLKVDIDEAEDVAQKYEISVMPTFKVFVNGVVADTIVGANVSKLEELFKKYQ